MKENDNAPNQCGFPSPISVNCPGQHTTTMCNSVINTTFPKRIDIALQLIMSIQENILEKYKSNSDVTQREDTWLQYLKRFVVIRVRLSNIQFLKCYSSLTAQIHEYSKGNKLMKWRTLLEKATQEKSHILSPHFFLNLYLEEKIAK